MGFLSIVLIVVFIATAILLIGIVLLQDEQGEGLGGIFGGGSSTPFGSRSGNVLTRFTSILGAIFLFCAFGIAWVNRSTQAGDVLAAAKKAQADQSTEWWNAPVTSNQNIGGNQSGTTTAGASQPAAAQQSGATTSSGGNPQQPAAASPQQSTQKPGTGN